MINGLSHITFIVRDLNKMEDVLTTVLDGRKIYDSGTQIFSYSKERFFDVGGIWIAIMEGNPLNERSYNHIAFALNAEEFDEKLRRIRALGLTVKEDRSRVSGEGCSLYFYDYAITFLNCTVAVWKTVCADKRVPKPPVWDFA
ncbi:MAG: VOC family protein [Paracoccaceae bacterium]